MDRKQNEFGTERIRPNMRLERAQAILLKSQPLKLNETQRPIVEKAVREVCGIRTHILRAINVRTNHVHTVVSAAPDRNGCEMPRLPLTPHWTTLRVTIFCRSSSK